MVDLLNPALVGEVVVLLLLLGIVWFVFKEVTRMALKILIPAALLMGVAVWLGVLDETVAGTALAMVGDGVLSVVRGVAGWVTSAAFSG